MTLTFVERDNHARAEVSKDGIGYRVTGHIGGELFGRDGEGHWFVGPGAAVRARAAAIEIAYGKRFPALGARSGITQSGLAPVIVLRRAS